jgi:hypothetical protein
MTDEQEQTSEEAVPGDSSLPDETVSDEEPASNIADPEEPVHNIGPGETMQGEVKTQTETFVPDGETPTGSTSLGTTETTMPVAADPQATADAAQAEANAHPSVSADNPPA